MSDARATILKRIKSALDQGATGRVALGEIEGRLAQPRRNPTPGRARIPSDELINLFVTMAEEASASVARVPASDDVPGAVLDYLRSQNLAPSVVMAPALDHIDWSRAPLIEIRRGAARPEDMVSVTGAFAAVAETGTLMLAAGREHPTTLNFLPDTHVVVIERDQILSTYEDGWTRLRSARRQGDGTWSMPRAVNFVTGPSRSADIEQKLQMGAHGPRRVHIIIVDSGLGHGVSR